MPKVKVSATIDPARLEQARRVTAIQGLSELLNLALAALVERELEGRWLRAHPDESLPGQVTPDLSDTPWDAK